MASTEEQAKLQLSDPRNVVESEIPVDSLTVNTDQFRWFYKDTK